MVGPTAAAAVPALPADFSEEGDRVEEEEPDAPRVVLAAPAPLAVLSAADLFREAEEPHPAEDIPREQGDLPPEEADQPAEVEPAGRNSNAIGILLQGLLSGFRLL